MTAAEDGRAAPVVEVIPLGGLGEFGMNMLLVVCGEHALLVDAGVMFPEPELFGVDLVIPDLTALDPYRGRIVGLVLTHGHEDHIGAVAHVFPRVEGPIFGTRFTLALVEPKLEEHGVDAGDRLVAVEPRQTVTAGPFRIEFLRVTHSMPDCVALAIHTPAGVILHTGDFKIDQTPLDAAATDLHRFAELGSAGVLALLSDSTNADRAGFTGSERSVISGFEEIFASAQGKIVVTAFSTSVYRMQVLVDLAEQFGRRVAFVGRGMQHVSQIAERLRYLRIPAGLQIRDSDVRDFPSQDVLCLCTGSQGEPLAALPRIAIDDHRHVKLAEDDVVVFSARVIPGNDKAIARVMNHVARRGAEIVADGQKHVHVSGHGSEEELKLIISLVRPRYFVPIHGEYRQLARHARMATLVCPTTTVLMAQDGDVLRFDGDGGRVADRVPAGRVLIDGTRTGEIADEVLRDRRHLAGDGLVVPVVAINGQTGALEQPPELITRGLAIDSRHEAMLREAPELLARAIEAAPYEERTDPGLLKERVRSELQRWFRKKAGRRPLVLPVVLEV
ncbi:MAG TPA: ribonuclease J [Vicinamibacterales bacterium]|nr:ribonuclease J [Vicinamibacterales bacterium]